MLQPVRRVDFIPATASDVPDCFVSIAGSNAPTLVAIHGISRNAAELATRFAQHPAFRDVNIVAPLFERKRFGKYQQLLARRTRETPADQALFALLEALSTCGKIPSGKVMLFGFSGGAQMAHRLAILHPDRVSRLCAASAGWYLLPDPTLPYPYGLGPGCPGNADDLAYLDLPITVIVGDRDTRIDASVSQDPIIVSRQGTNRLQRGRAWADVLAERARAAGRQSRVAMVTLSKGSHDFGRCAREAGLIDQAAAALLA